MSKRITDDDVTLIFLAVWAPLALVVCGVSAVWRRLRGV